MITFKLWPTIPLLWLTYETWGAPTLFYVTTWLDESGNGAFHDTYGLLSATFQGKLMSLQTKHLGCLMIQPNGSLMLMCSKWLSMRWEHQALICLLLGWTINWHPMSPGVQIHMLWQLMPLLWIGLIIFYMPFLRLAFCPTSCRNWKQTRPKQSWLLPTGQLNHGTQNWQDCWFRSRSSYHGIQAMYTYHSTWERITPWENTFV